MTNTAATDEELSWRSELNSIAPACVAAYENGGVQYTHLCLLLHGPLAQGPPSRRLLDGYSALRQAFEAREGPIIHELFASSVKAGVALTQNGRLHTAIGVGFSRNPEVERWLADCEHANHEVCRLLIGSERDICSEKLYQVADAALAAASYSDAAAAEKRFEVVKARFQDARDAFESFAARQASLQYFYGMLWGIPALGVSAALAATALLAVGTGDHTMRLLFVAVATGGLGAIVSVMSRMTVGDLKVEWTSGDAVLRLLGAVRPFVGAIFGVALYMLLRGGILPFDTPSSDAGTVAFYGILAFLGGFSERWAQDMLGTHERQLHPGAARPT